MSWTIHSTSSYLRYMLSPFIIVLVDSSESYTNPTFFSTKAGFKIPFWGFIDALYSLLPIWEWKWSTKLSAKKPDFVRLLPWESNTSKILVSNSNSVKAVVSSSLSTRFSILLISFIVYPFVSTYCTFISESLRVYGFILNL